MAKKEKTKKTATVGPPDKNSSPSAPADPEEPLRDKEDPDQLPPDEDIDTPPFEKASPGEGP